MYQFLIEPWPWYISGPLIGLTIPMLLLLGNKRINFSKGLRSLCQAILPSSVSFMEYNWKSEIWNFYFMDGLLIGGWIAGFLLSSPMQVDVSSTNYFGLLNMAPAQHLFSPALFSLANFQFSQFILLVVGGVLTGFGSQWARGGISGHAVLGVASLQWPSFLATILFFLGALIAHWFIIPLFFL